MIKEVRQMKELNNNLQSAASEEFEQRKRMHRNALIKIAAMFVLSVTIFIFSTMHMITK